MKKSKTPKSVEVTWKEETYTSLRSSYQCPVCRTVFEGSLTKRITRFICDCGQELIVAGGLKE